MSCFSVAESGKTGFLHGVGSFDPLADSVLIWTRVTPPADLLNADLQLEWQISTAGAFDAPLIQNGYCTTSAARDFTCCVDVKGLQPSTRYYYRFIWGNHSSPTGITKTTPSATSDSSAMEMKIALVSCANYAFGYFNVYDLATKIDDLDLVIHAGDYIYEYEKYNYPDRIAMARHGLRPKHHCNTLADYRQRYGCYRLDPALQELHRTLPMVVVWDDHEVGDSAFKTGDEDFEGDRRQFEMKKHNAVKAHAEWVPIRGHHPDSPSSSAPHRTFSYGNLMTLILVENRISKRDKPLDVDKTPFYAEVACKHMKKWNRESIAAAKAQLKEKFKDPSRTMLGAQQVQDIGTAVQDSVSSGVPWQFFVSQTIFSQLYAPRLLETLPLQPRLLRWICSGALNVATNDSIAGSEAARLARMYLGMGRFGVEMNPDAWDGYQAERQKVLEALNVPGANPIILAGDSHNAWAHEVMTEGGQRIAVEFDGPAVTSIGAFEDIHGQFEKKVGRLAKMWPLYLFSPWIQDALKAANPDTLEYCNLTERGLVLFHVTQKKVHAEYHYVDTVKSGEYKSHCEAAFTVEAGKPGVLHPVTRYCTVDGKIPKRTVRRRVAFIKGIHDVSSSMARA